MELESRRSPDTLAVLVVGTDTVIEALPARPVQLAHACGALGFDLVVPLSWGDELVADATVRALNARSRAPAILCSCPIVRQRLLRDGSELAGSMISLVAPPVAVARYLRSRLGERLRLLSFVGRCPGARHEEYDQIFEPRALLSLLTERGIEIRTQPEVFTDRLPPDRRRHLSMPGGCPGSEVLWRACNERGLVELDDADMAVELAQLLLSPRSVLVDAAAALGCACSGVTDSTSGPTARIAVSSVEPPRSPTPVLTDAVYVELEISVRGSEVQPAKALGDTTHADISTVSTPRAPMAVTPPGALAVRK